MPKVDRTSFMVFAYCLQICFISSLSINELCKSYYTNLNKKNSNLEKPMSCLPFTIGQLLPIISRSFHKNLLSWIRRKYCIVIVVYFYMLNWTLTAKWLLIRRSLFPIGKLKAALNENNKQIIIVQLFFNPWPFYISTNSLLIRDLVQTLHTRWQFRPHAALRSF